MVRFNRRIGNGLRKNLGFVLTIAVAMYIQNFIDWHKWIKDQVNGVQYLLLPLLLLAAVIQMYRKPNRFSVTAALVLGGLTVGYSPNVYDKLHKVFNNLTWGGIGLFVGAIVVFLVLRSITVSDRFSVPGAARARSYIASRSSSSTAGATASAHSTP